MNYYNKVRGGFFIMKSCFITSILIVVVGFLILLLADWGSFSITVNGSNFIDLICLAIFIFIVYFICTFKNWNKTARKHVLTCIIVYCCFNVFTVYSNFGIMCIRRDYEGTKRNACWNNIKIITEAVEMYNMDNNVMMSVLDIRKLIDSSYFSKELSFPSYSCYYTNLGDLTNDGFVCCAEHFSPYSELSYNGYNINYMEKDNYKNYLSRGFDISFDRIKELQNKFKELKSKKGDSGLQRDEFVRLNKTLRAKKPFLERARLHFKENRETYIKCFYPFIVLFFPYVLHPLR